MADPVEGVEADLLPRFLVSRDAPCPSCGYSLRGLSRDRCPECNEVLILQVGMAEPRLGAYLAALAGHLSAVGAAAVCLTVALVFTAKHGSPAPHEQIAVYGIPVMILLLQGVPALFLCRRGGRVWFRRRSGGQRAMIVLSGWALLGAFVTWFLAVVM